MTTQRWTDEMLDQLATSVAEVRESVREQQENIVGMQVSISGLQLSVTEMRESITEMKDSIDGLRLTSQALLQVAAQSQRDMEAVKERQTQLEKRQAESDERFNILLEELRYLNRRQDEE